MIKQNNKFSSMRIMHKSYLLQCINKHIINYPTPINLTYAWSFGSLAGFSLIIQIVTGIALAIHYVPSVETAYNSIQYIMRDVPGGWFFRYAHSNGASMFFIVVYCHLFRGLYYGSYIQPRHFVWCSGVILMLLMMGTAFTGYVLPWGQMSFWGATVITSMVTILPKGQIIAEWIWGGYVIKDPTLRRFYVVHIILPFIISAFSIIHIILLHKAGSNQIIGGDFDGDFVTFFPYFLSKDLFALAVYLSVFGYFIFFDPDLLNHPDNYIRANSMKTPLHVVPEWYFLPFYAILRGIPHKTIGILAMFGSIVILFFLPFSHFSNFRNTTYRPIFKLFFWGFVADCGILLWVGAMDIKYKRYLYISQIATVYYFLFFIIFLPFSSYFDSFYHKNNKT